MLRVDSQTSDLDSLPGIADGLGALAEAGTAGWGTAKASAELATATIIESVTSVRFTSVFLLEGWLPAFPDETRNL